MWNTNQSKIKFFKVLQKCSCMYSVKKINVYWSSSDQYTLNEMIKFDHQLPLCKKKFLATPIQMHEGLDSITWVKHNKKLRVWFHIIIWIHFLLWHHAWDGYITSMQLHNLFYENFLFASFNIWTEQKVNQFLVKIENLKC